MGRALRHHNPGSAFHIVARTQGKEPWFTDAVKGRIAEFLLQGAVSVGGRPIAFAVMDTHFHLVVLQSNAHLGEMMQPVMRRIALLVQKTQQREGHVFERRYRSKMCQDAEHLPNAILYVHRNPVKAGICKHATQYKWSSAGAFAGACPPGLICVEDGLRAFDNLGISSLDGLREVYQQRFNAVKEKELDGYWDWFWRDLRRRRGASQPYVPRSPHVVRAPITDLRDAAQRILRAIDRAVPIELVRSRYGGAAIVSARSQLVAALSQRGYKGVDIARYLHISEATVSRIKAGVRWGTLPQMVKTASFEDGNEVR